MEGGSYHNLDSTKLAVIIEKRDVPQLPAVLISFMTRVPHEWPFVAYLTDANYNTIRRNHYLAPYLKSGKLQLKMLPDVGTVLLSYDGGSQLVN